MRTILLFLTVFILFSTLQAQKKVEITEIKPFHYVYMENEKNNIILMGFGNVGPTICGASSGNCCYLIKYAQQVIKKRRKNRVIKVERRLIIGTESKMEQLLFESEDSSTINTSFILMRVRATWSTRLNE